MAGIFEFVEEIETPNTCLLQSDIRRQSVHSTENSSHFGDKTAAVAREQVLDIIRSDEVVDEMAKKISGINRRKQVSKCHLQMDVVAGRAFVDFIVASKADTGSAADASTLTCCVFVEGHRSNTRPTPCKCEPQFGDTLYFDLSQSIQNADWLTESRPVSITVINTGSDGSRSILSSANFDWREVIAMADCRAKVALELLRAGVVVGILDLRITVHLPDIAVPCPSLIKDRMEADRAQQAKLTDGFVKYARTWWREYLDIRPSHADRLVRIFARAVGGEHRMVCTFVRPPLDCCRLLDTARRALRFVALLRRPQSPMRSPNETWKTPIDLLHSGNGHEEDRSVLLCSLLLSLGLVAYVSLGTDHGRRGCAWVVTFGFAIGDVTFWDALHGERYRMSTTVRDLNCPYQTIDCLFNDQSFHANCQPSNEISTCDFDVSDGTLWKSMKSESVKRLSMCRHKWSLAYGDDIDAVRMSRQLESTLKMLIARYRKDRNFDTCWNDQMGIILGPALATYENEKQTGLLGETDDFLEAVRHLVPDGHTFKGFPNNSRQADGPHIFQQCLKSEIFKDILSSRGDAIQFSVHSKVYVFPEDLLSVWTMLAVTYLPIP